MTEILEHNNTIERGVIKYIYKLLDFCVDGNNDRSYLIRYLRDNSRCFIEMVFDKHNVRYSKGSIVRDPCGFLSFMNDHFTLSQIYKEIFVFKLTKYRYILAFFEMDLNITFLEFDLPYFNSRCTSDYVQFIGPKYKFYHTDGSEDFF